MIASNSGTVKHAKAHPENLRAALRSRGGAQFESVPKASNVMVPESNSVLESGSHAVWSGVELLHSLEKQLKAPWLASEAFDNVPPHAPDCVPPHAPDCVQHSLRDVLRSRGGVQKSPTHQKSPDNTQMSSAVTEKVTEFLGALGSASDSLTNGVSTFLDGVITQQPGKKEDDIKPLASVLRQRGGRGAEAEDGYEMFFEYTSEPQKEITTETCRKESDDEQKSPPKEEGSKNSLAAVLRRRGGSVVEDGFEVFYEYKSEGTPQDTHAVENPWTDQIRRNLKKPQSFHLPENDIEVDSPQQKNESSDLSRFMHLQSLWESRTPYAGANLNESTRMSKTEAQSALQRLSMKGIFGPGDLDEVRKLRQALLDADGDLDEH